MYNVITRSYIRLLQFHVYGYYNYMYNVITITCIRLLQLHVLGYYNYMYKVNTEKLKKIKKKKFTVLHE